MANNLTDGIIKQALDRGDCTYGKKKLGKGSYGTVVLAQHKDNKFYAVKIMQYSEDRVKYHTRELDALMELKPNPNVVKYIGHWVSLVEGEQHLCIRMELCSASLATWMEGNPNVVQDGDFYKHVFPQILNGLATIHDSGWVHRDLNPCNILIGNPNPKNINEIIIKIADFGLARDIGEPGKLTSQQNLDQISPDVGNCLYRAPEISKCQYNHKVDLYSAGIILYFLSCVKDATMWMKEIEYLKKRNGIIDVATTFHKDATLVELIGELMKYNPEERPTARQAYDRYFKDPAAWGKSPQTGLEFLAREENEEVYTRCSSSDVSLYGIKQGIQKRNGIAPENQTFIYQERVNESGKTVPVYVASDVDVEKMIESAGKNSKISLVFSGKKLPTQDESVPMDL